MESTPFIAKGDEQLYNNWISKLKLEIEKVKNDRYDMKPDEENTLHKVANYSGILQYKIHSSSAIMDFFTIFVQSLINPIRVANVPTVGIGLRPCELWEHFAAYYLDHIDIECIPPVKLVQHTGQRNDRGVDVLCKWKGEKAVVQVKRGSFFSTGKGTDIVLKLIGSMIISDAKTGIIFTNENENEVKSDAKEIIEIAHQREMKIYILGKTEIFRNAKEDPKQCKKLMVKFIHKFFQCIKQ